jgi:predicted dehydrogenase
MKVAVLGYGLIGKERVSALARLRDEESLVSEFAVHDPFAGEHRARLEAIGGRWCDSLAEVRAFSPAWVIIATPHDTAVQLCEEVIPWGTAVLLEKPFGRTGAEAERLARLAEHERQLWIGFNYRFFPGIAAALSDALAGRFGAMISVAMTLGHGGSPDMRRGWKLDPARAGGGCLIDPGVHLLDLCHRLAGDLTVEHASAWRGFWSTGIEEEVHLVLHAGDVVFNLQISLVRWRSTFRLELHGTDGYGRVSGRGRSYGPMIYTRGRRWGWQSAPSQALSEEIVSTSQCEDSFRDELRALFASEGERFPAPCSMREALRVMRTYDACRARL